MPLNYSKWDQLELSDDSDIEGHPNVDKRSLIRWKQRDIHEKRELRKHTIAKLTAQIACNKVLLPKITEISKNLADESRDIPASAYFNGLVEQLQKNPSRDCPPGNDPSKLEQTYDGMLLSLFQQVAQDSKNKLKDANILESEKDAKLGKLLATNMAEHVTRLGGTIQADTKKLEEEEQEQKKKITSDDIHEGFSNKYNPTKSEPSPAPTTKPKKKETTAEFEVLNPKAPEASPSKGPTAPATAHEEDEEDLPELTPALEAFSKIPVYNYERAFEFIQTHNEVLVTDGASDALLVSAFRAQGNGKSKYAKQCVNQSLLLQYCEKLGKDGVSVFFKKMISGDARAKKVFEDDMENTYAHLVERVQVSKEEEATSAGKEQIQLVAEDPNIKIGFNVPDGPPPEDLRLEGPGTENMDIDEVRKALQFRWDVFQGFPENFQAALKTGELDEVNKILGDLDVTEAESIVQQLDMAGILSFAEGGIRDETGKDGDGGAEN